MKLDSNELVMELEAYAFTRLNEENRAIYRGDLIKAAHIAGWKEGVRSVIELVLKKANGQ